MKDAHAQDARVSAAVTVAESGLEHLDEDALAGALLGRLDDGLVLARGHRCQSLGSPAG